MPPVSLAFAKNVARRAFTQLVDPSPDRAQVARLWEYFEGRCAYCDRALDRGRKEGHIDHLTPAALGGRNGMANRALACAPCNEVEKRDLLWRAFLDLKCPNAAVRAVRAARISAWQAANQAGAAVNPELAALADAAGDEVAAVIDRLAAGIRARRGPTRARRVRAPAAHAAAEGTGAQYASTRLTFRANVIEQLADDGVFRVDTPDGSYQMRRSEFERVFANVVASRSYRDGRVYSYSALPAKALPFRVAEARCSDARPPHGDDVSGAAARATA